jgi:hypothetical protein
MEATAYKLNVKVAGAEFSAEGSEATVKEQFGLFLDALKAIAPKIENRSAAAALNGDNHQACTALAVTGVNTAEQPYVLSPTILKRAFLVDSSGTVSLRVLPQTERRDADALLAILYGFRVFSERHEVGGTTLLSAAKQSGLQLDRVDRVLAVHSNLITTGGLRKGKRYGLNNRGLSTAEEIITGMFE